MREVVEEAIVAVIKEAEVVAAEVGMTITIIKCKISSNLDKKERHWQVKQVKILNTEVVAAVEVNNREAVREAEVEVDSLNKKILNPKINHIKKITEAVEVQEEAEAVVEANRNDQMLISSKKESMSAKCTKEASLLANQLLISKTTHSLVKRTPKCGVRSKAKGMER